MGGEKAREMMRGGKISERDRQEQEEVGSCDRACDRDDLERRARREPASDATEAVGVGRLAACGLVA